MGINVAFYQDAGTGQVLVYNCVFRNCEYGIIWPFAEAAIFIEQCLFENDTIGFYQHGMETLTMGEVDMIAMDSPNDLLAEFERCEFSSNGVGYKSSKNDITHQVLLTECEFKSNEIAVEGGCTMDQCQFDNNSLVFRLERLGGVTISNSMIISNSTIAIIQGFNRTSEAELIASLCVFRDNNIAPLNEQNYEGGIQCHGHFNFQLENCIYYRNSKPITAKIIEQNYSNFRINSTSLVRNNYSALEFINLSEDPDVKLNQFRLTNSIIAFNEQFGLLISNTSDSLYLIDSVSCCDIYGNPDDYTAYNQFNNNLSVDPLFLGLETGDLRLSENSPCRNLSRPCSLAIGVSYSAFIDIDIAPPSSIELLR